MLTTVIVGAGITLFLLPTALSDTVPFWVLLAPLLLIGGAAGVTWRQWPMLRNRILAWAGVAVLFWLLTGLSGIGACCA